MDSNPGNEKKRIVLISQETIQKKNDKAASKKNEARTERTAQTIPSKASSSGTRRIQTPKQTAAATTGKASAKARPAAARLRTSSSKPESKLPETSLLNEASPKKAAAVPTKPKNGTGEKKPAAAVPAASRRGNGNRTASAETASRQTKTRARKRVTKKLPTVVLMTLIMLIIAACVFILWERTDSSLYIKAYEAGQTIAGSGVEVTFLECSVMNELLTYPLDPNYVYVKAVYVVRNTLATAKDWHIMPYLTLAPYTSHEEGYMAVPYEKSVGKTSDTASAYTDEDFYGVFDFNVLQIFGLERGIDFTDIKADLEPGAIRICADVFRIKKELFDNTVYFIGMDNIPAAIVRIGSEDDIGIWEFDPESNTAVNTTVPAGQ